jgi:hypothetical protein
LEATAITHPLHPDGKPRKPFLYKPLLFCGGRGEGREKQGQKMEKTTLFIIPFFAFRSTENSAKRQQKGPFGLEKAFWTVNP